MIKINLLGDASGADNSNKVQLALYCGSLALCLVVFYFVQSSYSGSLGELNDRVQQLQDELKKRQKVTAEVRDYEQKQADYNAKLLVVATLKKNKSGPVRVMDDLNMALPEKAWLSEIRESAGIFYISGKALDHHTISEFMRELERSDYFDEARNQLIKKTDHEGVRISEFSFQAGVRYSGKHLTVEELNEKAGSESDKKVLLIEQSEWLAALPKWSSKLDG